MSLINELFLGPDHPITKIVRENRNQVWRESLSETEQWFLQTKYYFSQLNDTSIVKTENEKLALLNQIGVYFIKQTIGII